MAVTINTRLLYALLLAPLALAQNTPALEAQATAIFQKRCLTCHDANTRTAGLDLTNRAAALKGGKTGAALVPGDVAHSLLASRISAGQMPLGNPLPAEERQVILAWIQSGAPWSTRIETARRRAGPDWWSLQPLRRGAPPEPAGTPAAWSRSPIDRFLYAELRRRNLQPAPPADRRTLIRRATFDLLGLPPTPAEIEAFIADSRPDAYERLLDHLLASPHYGERWGRHWLDVVRFGESEGYEQNLLRNRAWPYRDYVIRSFNDDKPFPRMILEQIAGDQIAPGDADVEVATGFLVAGVHDTVKIANVEGEALKRANDLDDIISAVGASFLGLTVNCARCHDHKFDPIQQADYYRLSAVFAGVEHGERALATAAETERLRALEAPLRTELKEADRALEALRQQGETLVAGRQAELAAHYRPPVEATGTAETFPPVEARFIRMTILDTLRHSPPFLDEVEIFAADAPSLNVAMASHGAKATASSSRSSGTAALAYQAENIIDGKFDKAWISGDSGKGQVTIELARPEKIGRIFWSRDRQGGVGGRFLNGVPTRYVFEASLDGRAWQTLATSDGRLPYDPKDRAELFLAAVLPDAARQQWRQWNERRQELEKQIAALPKLRMAYIGQFVEPAEPSCLMKRGNPMDKGEIIAPASLSTLAGLLPGFQLDPAAAEGKRRLALAQWIADDRNALTARVLANRVWHYHFGHGLVGTPSDFGFNGEQPSHPELLDWLAGRLQELGWRLKPLHRELMLSAAYRQSTASNPSAIAVDAGDRLLWRFPPQRLDAEQLRDTVLSVSGKLDPRMGGEGFRLFKYTVDNVATYFPGEASGPETWRRAVYQQAARSVKDDMLGNFDCPDSSLTEPKRMVTTTPLQALTLLNSAFMMEQSRFFAERLERENPGGERKAQIDRAFRLAFGRAPDRQEIAAALELIQQSGLTIFCRAIFNANEFLYVE